MPCFETLPLAMESKDFPLMELILDGVLTAVGVPDREGESVP
jgi:hypothetical protein